VSLELLAMLAFVAAVRGDEEMAPQAIERCAGLAGGGIADGGPLGLATVGASLPACRALVAAFGSGLGPLETTVDDPGAGPARHAMAGGAAVLVVAGGDGTVMACANALGGTGMAVAVLPCGPGNLLARNLGLPMHLGDAVAVPRRTACKVHRAGVDEAVQLQTVRRIVPWSSSLAPKPLSGVAR
jgi:hypothetical protein